MMAIKRMKDDINQEKNMLTFQYLPTVKLSVGNGHCLCYSVCPTLVWDYAGQPGPGPSLRPFEQSNNKILELNFTIIYANLVKHPPVPVNPLSSMVVLNIPFGDGKLTTFRSVQK